MKQMKLWMLAVILVICGVTIASISLRSCEKAHAQEDNPAPCSTPRFHWNSERKAMFA